MLVTKRKGEKEPRPIEMDSDFMARMEEKSMREALVEKQKLDSLREREKRISTSVQRKRVDVKSYIAERRELWSQKIENIQENKGIANEANVKHFSCNRSLSVY